MNGDEGEDTRTYKVVVNHEEQYSIWPAERTNPLGWRDAGKTGPRAECLEYIEQVWTDMRPLSLRKWMEEAASRPVPPPTEAPSVEETPRDSRTGSALVDKLCEGDHPIEASLRPERTVERFKQTIDDGYVHIKFTDTRGGTELGVRLDRERSDLGRADFPRHTGTVRLVGTLTLDYVPVRCVATIELPTLTGRGHLEVVEA
jgi:uncharacterized protein YbdZ (MbtH family)